VAAFMRGALESAGYKPGDKGGGDVARGLLRR